ncbi:MAG: hypothetical protein GY850_46215, partial [bacterium]|nr:hypothetical protein [bacterium]
QLPLDEDDSRTEYSVYLTHQLTESNRLRIQFKNSQRSYGKDSNEVFLQWVFTLGSHGHDHDEEEDDDDDHGDGDDH